MRSILLPGQLRSQSAETGLLRQPSTCCLALRQTINLGSILREIKHRWKRATIMALPLRKNSMVVLRPRSTNPNMSKRALTNWIPYDKGLTLKEEILTIAAETGMNQWEVAGRLMDFWSFLDANFVPNEMAQMCLKKITIVPLQSTFLSTELITAMVQVGWLVEDEDSYIIPHADRFLGESAKKRLKHAEKMRNQRIQQIERANSVPSNVPSVTAQKVAPEKEKEKEKHISSTSTGFAEAPSLEEAIRSGETKSIPKALVEKWWTNNQLKQWEILDSGIHWSKALWAYWTSIPPKAQQDWREQPKNKRSNPDIDHRTGRKKISL